MGWDEWFSKFCSKSGTSYKKSKADRINYSFKRTKLAGFRKCIHNVKKKKTEQTIPAAKVSR